MITVKIQGGLGNQLFQYATGRAVALRNKTSLALDISAYATADRKRELSLDHFNTHYAPTSFWKKIFSRHMTGQADTFNEEILRVSKNVYLQGYWPFFQYFTDIQDILRKEITLRHPEKLISSDIFRDVTNSLSVAIHVRRGDYTRIHNDQGSILLSIDYYTRAVEFLLNKYPSAKFFIFSDDIPWCKENLSSIQNLSYINENRSLSDPEEFILLSHCKHQIIANSTLSAWAAWLNPNRDKVVVTPKDWRHSTDPSLPEWVGI